MGKLPFLDLGADPAEAGRAQGQALNPAIRNNLETYFRRFETSGSPRALVLEEAEKWAAFMKEDSPAYFSEMAGIAEGAELSVTELTVLNARYEITYAVYARDAQRISGDEADLPEQEGCTLWGVMPEATADGSCMMGQNWDWLAGLLGNCVVKRVRRAEAGLPDYIGFTEAGIVGCKMALNSAGLGICLSGLIAEDEGLGAPRTPTHVRCAQVMDADRLSEAIRAIIATNRTCSTNFMLGHGAGEIIDIEATRERCAYMYPDDAGVVTHANHLEAEKSVSSNFERLTPSSLFRPHRVRRHFRHAAGRIDMDVVRETMSDHFSYPNSVCQHPDPKVASEIQGTTVTSVAMDLTRGIFWASDGPPCEAPFERFTLQD